jgi:hypothetical protein
MGCGSSKESAADQVPNRIHNPQHGGTPTMTEQQRLPSQNENPAAMRTQNGGREWVSAPRTPAAKSPPPANPPALECGSAGIFAPGTLAGKSSPPANTPAFQDGSAGSSSSEIIRWPKVIKPAGTPFVVYVYYSVFLNRDKPIWTYVSEGLSAFNQPEIVFALALRPNEHIANFPEGPVEWMQTVYLLAKQGLNLEVGQMCDLVFGNTDMHIRINNFALVQDPSKWMSLRRFGILVHGLSIYTSDFALPPDAFPHNAHHVIALTHEEAIVARQFGPTRVIGHVGRAIRWFPHPPWVDRDREDCVSMADQAGSIRIGVPIIRIYGFNAIWIPAEDEIVLIIPDGEKKRNTFRKFVMDVPLTGSLAFESFMAEEANGGLIWKTGQKDIEAYMSNW